MTERNNVLYIHRRLTDRSIFYVGIGKPDRPWVKSRKNKYWQNTVAKHGYTVQVVSDNLTWDEATQYEKELIASLRAAGARLTNLTDGGEGTQGYRHTDETKAEISKIVSRAMKSPEVRKKLISAWSTPEVKAKVSGANNHNFGRTPTPETREKISAANKGMLAGDKNPMRRPEVAAKLTGEGNGFYGKKHTEESRLKMAEYFNRKEVKASISRRSKDNWLRPEYRARFTGANHPCYGKQMSDESKAKMSASKKGVYIGSKHHNFDSTVRRFVSDYGDTFTGTQYDLSLKYGLNRGHISAVVRGDLKQHKGWRYVGLAEPTQLSLLAA